MGVLQRFKDIMSSNINALLDKAEDPEKMIDQCLRNLQSDLSKVKAETASVMAEEARTKRELDECNAEIEKFAKYAEKAVLAGNDTDATRFLEEKGREASKLSTLQQQYELAKTNATKMRQMHDKLVKDINELESRKDMIKSKIAVAKTQERINKIGSSVNSANNSMSAFDRMEAKANKMLDSANAMAELNSGADNDLRDLTSKYAEGGDASVNDELAALKARLGK